MTGTKILRFAQDDTGGGRSFALLRMTLYRKAASYIRTR